MNGSELLIGLKEAARLAPGAVHPSAVWRWCRRGILARNGARIFLAHVRCGGKLLTSAERMRGFFEAVARADQEHFCNREESGPPREAGRALPRRREQAIERARREMQRNGL